MASLDANIPNKKPAKAKRPARIILRILIFLGIAVFGLLGIINIHEGNTKGTLIQLGAIVLTFVLCPIAWNIGDALRKFAMPSMYFAEGFGGLVKAKIFWMIGPQCVGVFMVLALLFYGATNISGALPEDKGSVGKVPGQAQAGLSSPSGSNNPALAATDSGAAASANQSAPDQSATSGGVVATGAGSNAATNASAECAWNFSGTKTYTSADRGDQPSSGGDPSSAGMSSIRITRACYAPDHAIDGCHSEFGGKFRLLDWSDLLSMNLGEADLEKLEDSLGIAHYNAAWVRSNSFGGSEGYDSDGRHYFFVRDDGEIPSDFRVFGYIGNHDAELGSWNEYKLPSLCIAN